MMIRDLRTVFQIGLAQRPCDRNRFGFSALGQGDTVCRMHSRRGTELTQGIAHSAAAVKIRLHFDIRVAAGGIVPLLVFPQQIVPAFILAKALTAVIVKILNAFFKGRFIPPGDREMSVPNEKQVRVNERDELVPLDRLIGCKLCTDGIFRLLERLLTEIVVSAVGVMQRAEEQVHILKRFRARKNRLAGIVQIFQAVDLCLRDLDLAAVML